MAQHQTAHNSGVVHAGLYYPPGSLKARLCVHGMSLLKAFCLEHEIPYDECGKLVIATGEREMTRFDALEERARANGVPGLRRLGESAAPGDRAQRHRDRRAALPGDGHRRFRRGGAGDGRRREGGRGDDQNGG